MHDALRIDKVRQPLACAAIWVSVPLLVLALTACGSSRHSNRATNDRPIQVTTEPVSTAGADRFTVPAGVDLQGLERLYGNLTSPSGRPPTYRGDRPGLYADTRGKPSCDATRLARSLEENPTEAAAWASTLGISSSQMRSYLASLTPVVLRVDTRVTNHGWTSGSVTRFQAVLQAGTSVLVDKYGQPVSKCYCGNPLTAPKMSSNASYTGPQWSGFSRRRLAAVERSTKPIRVFTLFDPYSNRTFQRTAGTHIPPGSVSATGTPTTSSSSTIRQVPLTSTTTEQTPVTSSPAEQTPQTTRTAEQNAPTSTTGTGTP